MRITCDFLVLGSGVAGLTFALEAAKHGQVIVATKRGLSDSNTHWAQGGIAAVMDPEHDSFEKHAGDTLRVGYGLSKPEVVEMVVRDGPSRVRELIARGAHFDAAHRAIGHRPVDALSDGQAEQRRTDGRKDRDAAGIDVGIRRVDQADGMRTPGVLVGVVDFPTHGDGVIGQRIVGNDARARQFVKQPLGRRDALVAFHGMFGQRCQSRMFAGGDEDFRHSAGIRLV